MKDNAAYGVFPGFSIMFRIMRPNFPKAEVFFVDTGNSDMDPNIVMTADTKTEEGEVTVIVCREYIKELAEKLGILD